MEKDRSSKAIAIVALLVAVVGLSLGFAAYSTTLTINSSAEYKSSEDSFKVVFSGADKSIVNTVSATPQGTGATGSEAIIEGDTTIKNLKASFTAPGQTVEYDFYVANIGSVDAYLNNVVFNAVTDGGTKKCTPKGTNPATNTIPCDDITVTVKFLEKDYKQSDSSIKNTKIPFNTYLPIKVIITYATGNSAADGDFDVEFGAISLGFDSIDK